MRVLVVGDVVGRPGRQTVAEVVPSLRRERGLDLVVANGENAAGRAGITPGVAEELWNAGVDVITLGDHAWDQKEIVPALDELAGIVRPANYPAAPGRGWLVVEAAGLRLAVLNLLGRVFLPIHPDCPFRTADRVLAELDGRVDAVLVDFHAEATSEKVALGWYLAGRVTALVGTHTHVQTADERILPGGTAYVTDAGMTGPADGVIGVEREAVLKRFLTQMPASFAPAKGARQFNGVLVEVDDATGRAVAIERITRRIVERGE